VSASALLMNLGVFVVCISLGYFVVGPVVMLYLDRDKRK
jgi:hypothetical protein